MGSGALAAPYSRFKGCWAFKNIREEEDSGLNKIKQFLYSNPQIAESYHYEAFISDLKDGLFFNSDIPVGYGLGSSGAVIAAFYSKYAKVRSSNPYQLKNILSTLEAVFHGASSGIDPLVSFLNVPVLIKKSGNIEMPELKNNTTQIFLVDTGIKRETSPLVSIFKTKLKNNVSFSKAINDLVTYNDKAIEAYTAGNNDALMACFKQISQIQYHHFKEMIPESIQEMWEMGLNSKDFSLKLCGAGGGGMIMGMTNNRVNITGQFSDFPISYLNA